MRDWLEEVWIVVCYSTRTQMAVAFAFIFFIATLLLGQALVDPFESHGFLVPPTDVIRDRLLRRYDKAAWFALGSFLLLAIKTYRQDRLRLLSL